jgi:hypothetical protein
VAEMIARPPSPARLKSFSRWVEETVDIYEMISKDRALEAGSISLSTATEENRNRWLRLRLRLRYRLRRRRAGEDQGQEALSIEESRFTEELVVGNLIFGIVGNKSI